MQQGQPPQLIKNDYFDTGTKPTNKLYTKNSKLVKYGARMICVIQPVLWNDFLCLVRDSPSFAKFKENFRTHFLYINRNMI